MAHLDQDKVLTYKRYMAKAAKRLIDRDLARESLQKQVEELRKVGSADLKGHIDELERRIAEAIEREQKLVTHHQMEDMFHRKLRDRIAALEQKIGSYLATREQRMVRIVELEQKVAERLSDRNAQLDALRSALSQLEAMASELEGEPRLIKQLRALQSRIDSVKKAIAARVA